MKSIRTISKNVPDGWERKKLGAIGKAIIGLTYDPKDVVSEGGTLVFRSSNIQNGQIEYSDQVRVSSPIPEVLRTREGDILICARNGSRNLIGKNIYITKQDAGNTFGAFMSVFRTDNPKYVHQLFKSNLFKKELTKDLGPTINQVTTGNLHSFKFLFPQLHEQNRIVKVLEMWDKTIEVLSKKIERKKEIKKGLMQNLLTGKIRLADFSGKWSVVGLGDVCSVQMGQSPLSSAYNEKAEGLPLVQGNNDIKDRKTIARIWTTEITKTANKGDIIMTVRAPVGWIGIATEKICIGRGVCAIKPTKADKDFIFHYLRYFEYKWRMLEQGSTFTAVNSSDVKEFEVKIPEDEKEQIAIANICTIADDEIIALEKKLTLLKDQKTYLLNNLITGIIRTPENI